MQKAYESTCVTGNGRRKKYVQNYGFWSWIFSQIPFARSVIFENPLGQHAVPSGIFKIPSGLQGSG